VKSFILRYRNEHGRDRLITIGRFDVWNTGTARTEAKRLLREEINIGDDPLGERKAKRDELTVNEMLDRYVESARFESKGEFTRYVDKGRLNRHVRPLLGTRMLSELTLGTVERAFADIASGKTAVGKIKTKKHGLARVTGGEGTARKAIQLFRAALSWAVREKLLGANPATGVELGKDGVRRLVLDPAQYTAMFEALDQLEGNGEGRVLPKHADAIRVIAMTGARRGEICGLRREHVDGKAGLIILPPA
jgi:integrase